MWKTAIILSVFFVFLPSAVLGGGGCRCADGAYKCYCVYLKGDEWTQTGQCYANYIPGGGGVKLDPIEPAVAKLSESAIATIAKDIGFLSDLADGTNDAFKIAEKFGGFAKKFAGGLGLFGTVISKWGSMESASPSDIIKAVNKAIKTMTDRVNDQFENMREYVDESIRNEKLDRMTESFQYFSQAALDCLPQAQIDVSKLTPCIDDANRRIGDAKVLFMKYAKNVGTEWTATTNEARLMELELPTIMNYAVLRISFLLISSGTYGHIANITTDDKSARDIARAEACMLFNLLEADIKEFKDYITMIYNQIYNQHDNRDIEYVTGPKEDPNLAEGLGLCVSWTDSGVSNKKCKYILSDMIARTSSCEIMHKGRHDNHCPGTASCQLRDLRNCKTCDSIMGTLHDCNSERAVYLFQKYTKQTLQSVENYWLPQTLGRFTAWNQILDTVEKVKEYNRCGEVQELTDQFAKRETQRTEL